MIWTKYEVLVLKVKFEVISNKKRLHQKYLPLSAILFSKKKKMKKTFLARQVPKRYQAKILGNRSKWRKI